MNNKLLGAILLIVGTSIGAGMLALPITTAQAGFFPSISLFVLIWFIMTLSAFLLLEVALALPKNSNLITMAKMTLGRGGQVVTWIVYLMLLYALTAAYIAGGGGYFQSLLQSMGLSVSPVLVNCIYTLILGAAVHCGIRSVDYLNRGLMLAKFASFGLLTLLILPFIAWHTVSESAPSFLLPSTMVVVTSFGFAIIIPSLRDYLEGHVAKLRLAVLVGSLIPLICYILWDLAIQGVLSSQSLANMAQSSNPTGLLVNTLSHALNRPETSLLAHVFTGICLLTSFLGVTLSLSDFLADGLGFAKTALNQLWVSVLTFLPPLLIVLVYPKAFIAALNYAGLACVLLLILLPALMAWSCRYHKALSSPFRTYGGKAILIALFSVSITLIIIFFFNY